MTNTAPNKDGSEDPLCEYVIRRVKKITLKRLHDAIKCLKLLFLLHFNFSIFLFFFLNISDTFMRRVHKEALAAAARTLVAFVIRIEIFISSIMKKNQHHFYQ